ncbi:MAG: type III secretion system cytoplasmic ring protein SctQ [Candidimonas sp.]
MTMPHSVFRPVLQLSESEAEAVGVIARRTCHGVKLALTDDEPWTCSLSSGATAALAAQCDLGVRLEWAGGRLYLRLPRRLAVVWLEARYRDVQFGDLPDEIFAAAFDAMLAQWMTLVDTSGLGKPRVMSVQDVQEADAQAHLPHAWTITLQSSRPDGLAVGELRCDGFALQLLAGLVAQLPEAENDIPVDQIPIDVALRIGVASLPWNTIRSLEAGDVVVLDRYYVDAQAGLWLCTESGSGLRVRHEDQHYVVTDSWKKVMTDVPGDELDGGDAVMSDDGAAANGGDAAEEHVLNEERGSSGDARDAAPESTASFDDVPVALDFDLGARRLPLGELRRLQPGDVFDLQRPLEDGPVRVRVNGVTVAYGELVDVDGRIGVRLLRLSRTGS